MTTGIEAEEVLPEPLWRRNRVSRNVFSHRNGSGWEREVGARGGTDRPRIKRGELMKFR